MSAPLSFEAEWNGVKLRIDYEPHWLNVGDTAHIEVRSVDPEEEPLPITDTGYRSHFTSPEIVEAYGGPVKLVMTWLDQESQSPLWAAKEISRRQFSLF